MGRQEFSESLDGRSFTSVIQGRRLREEDIKVVQPGMADILRKLQSNRKSHRLHGPAGQVAARLAAAADLVEGLSFEEKRALLITEIQAQLPEFTDRLMMLFGVGGKPIELFTEIVGRYDKAELFTLARNLGRQGPEISE